MERAVLTVEPALPRTTMRYDRARTSLDRHAIYIVAAFIAGAAR
jgi:integrase/recombinase XerD